MKPLEIVMSAFGSYSGEERVDFEKLDHGIFLITGDTGAGKTTIFDGVCFALFGETSGRVREGSMMRSQFASDERETFVSLRFSQKGQTYQVTRSPAYTRISRKKNKAGEYPRILVQAKAKLLMPDGTEFPGAVREVNQKIQEILGVDFNQFSQISMIAQGDYLKLLHASSRERKEIFSKIFNTGIYSRIQMKLKEENNRLYGGLEDNRKLISHELDNVVMPDAGLEAEWKELLEFRETGTDRIREALEKCLERTEAGKTQVGEKRKETAALLAGLEGKIRDAREKNSLFEEWEREKTVLADLLSRGQEQQKRKERLLLARRAQKVQVSERRFLEKAEEQKNCGIRCEKLQEEALELEKQRLKAEERFREINVLWEQRIPALQQRLLRLQDVLPLFAGWKQADREYRSCISQEKQMQEQEKEAREGLEASLARQKLLAERGRELARQAADLAECRRRMAAAETEREKALQLKRMAAGWDADVERLKKQQESLRETLDACTAAEQEYDRRYRHFLAAQAGIMAAQLTEGSACPVCGSLHHPQPAGLTADAITQADVEAARKEREQAEEARNAASQKTVRMAENCRQQEKRIREELKGLGQPAEESASGELIQKVLSGILAKSEENLAGIGRQLALAEEAQRSLTGNQEEQEAEERRRAAAEEKLSGISRMWQEKKVELAEKRTAAEQLKGRLPSETEEEVKASLASLTAEKDRLDQERSEAEQAKNERLQQEKEKKGRLISEQENAGLTAAAREQAEAAFGAALTAQGFPDAGAYREALQTEETVSAWEQECQSYEEALLRSRTIHAQFEKQLKEKTPEDIAPLQEQASRLKEEQTALEREEIRLAGIHSRNEQAEKNLRRLWKEREGLEEEYRLVRTLYQTANGKMTGSAGLDFQTYVQRQYFNQMIHAANRRLKVMSEGRFLLQCRQLDALGRQGEVGLDLDIYSLVTDKVRDVKTLSGGESFLAALAMALGMADVIQNAAGNVQIDAMFIDEGFGALDEESRLRAIRILQELAEGKRLIGIISHVPELKEQIERKLVVKKDEKGSHIEWKLGDMAE